MTRPAPSARSAYRAFRTLTTRWMDNDVYGHMNNVVHYSLFDTAVNGWLIETGLLDQLLVGRNELAIANAHASYDAVLSAGSRLESTFSRSQYTSRT